MLGFRALADLVKHQLEVVSTPDLGELDEQLQERLMLGAVQIFGREQLPNIRQLRRVEEEPP